MGFKKKTEVPCSPNFKVNSYIRDPRTYNIVDLVNYVGNTLLNIDNCTLNIYYNSNLLNHFSTQDLKLEALLDKTALENTYNLYIREITESSLEMILCHELVHLKQYIGNQLTLNKDNNVLTFSWKGEIYPSSTEYWDRPWEREARDQQYTLWRKFYKYYYRGNK